MAENQAGGIAQGARDAASLLPRCVTGAGKLYRARCAGCFGAGPVRGCQEIMNAYKETL